MVIRFKPRNIMCFIISYMMNFQAISTSVMNVVAIWKIPVLSSFATPLLYASFFASLLVGLVIVFARKWRLDRVLVFVFFLLSALITPLISPGSEAYMWTSFSDLLGNPAYIFWLYSFSLFLFSGCVDDLEMLTDKMEKMAYVAIGLSLLRYVASVGIGEAPEYMTFSYNMLFSVALLLILTIQKFSWPRIIAGAVGAVLIFVGGCRGALGGLLVSVFAYDLFSGKNRTQREKIVRILLMLFGVLVIISWRSVLEMIASALDAMDISSRTIHLMLEESFLDDSGRGSLLATVSQKISAFGYGLYGDRLVLNGAYVHNVFAEILIDYGIMFGTGLLLAWIGLVIYGMTRSPGEYRLMICALLSVGFVKIFFSGSFLNQEPGVFLLLGICMNGFNFRKRMSSKAVERNALG